MSGSYQLPGAFLTALCHVIVICHMAEHRYSVKKFALYSGIYMFSFVAMFGYGIAAGGMTGLFAYMGIVVVLFLYSCIVSQDGFSKKCFLFITYFSLFTILDNMLKLTVRLSLSQISEEAGYYWRSCFAEYLSNRLSVLQRAEEANRMLRHDMRHHMDAITEYAKTGDTSAILAYIGEYGTEISETAVKRYAENRTINSILSAYAGKAGEGGVSFSVRCNVPKELKIREIDLIALLGNLLENALHGCQESGKEKQCIEIHIRLQNNRLIIVCNNTCSDKLRLSDSLPAGKSIGISSILSVCRKYDGNLDYKIEKDVCSACAVLNL